MDRQLVVQEEQNGYKPVNQKINGKHHLYIESISLANTNMFEKIVSTL